MLDSPTRRFERNAPISGVIPAAVIAAGLTGPVAWSAPGDLDPTFGDFGFAELPQDLSGAVWALEALNDKYQAAGAEDYCSYYDYTCYTDPGFATGLLGSGIGDPVYRPAIPGNLQRLEFAWQSDGRLVGIGKNGAVGGYPYVVFRLTSDGSQDPTFGTGGTVTIEPATISSVDNIAIDPDGRIVIDGMQGSVSVMLRLMPDGSWDPSFGTNGVVRAPVNDGLYLSAGIVRNAGGAYRVLGGSQPDCRVHAVTASGSVDNGFGNEGSVGLAMVTGATFYCTRLDILPDGRLLVAGRNATGGAVVRLLATGALDATFTTDAGSYLGAISAMAVSPGGSVLVAGPDRGGLPGTVVARLLPGGQVDTGYGAQGKAWVDVRGGFGTHTVARTLVAPSDDQVLVAGAQASYWGSVPYVVRLAASGAGPGVIGIKTTDVQALESERQATVVVRRTGGSTGAVSVAYRTVPANYGPHATEGEDFEPAQGRLDWASGETADKTIVVSILGDQVPYEGNETFGVMLEDPSGGGLGRSAGVVTIRGDGYPHGAFSIFAGTPVVRESDSTAHFYVSRADGGSGAVSVTVEPVPGTAVQGTDFESGSVTLTWADGETLEKEVTVRITRDKARESDETFSMKLANPTGGAIIVPDGGSASVTIQDSRPPGGNKSGGGLVGLGSLLLLGLGALARLRARVVRGSVARSRA